MKIEQAKTKEIDAVEELTDLPVAEEHAVEAKGGATPKLNLVCADGEHFKA